MEESLEETLVRNGAAAARFRGLGHAALVRAGLSDGTANRLTGERPPGEKKKQNMQLATIAKLSTAVKFPAWMLLLPEFDPANRPAVMSKKVFDAEVTKRARKLAATALAEWEGLDHENVEATAAGDGGFALDPEPDERGRAKSGPKAKVKASGSKAAVGDRRAKAKS